MTLYKNAKKGGLPYPRKPRPSSKPGIVYGAGINDADYQVQITEGGKKVWECPIYRAWVAMLQRAYDPKCHEKYPTYKGVKVCTEWLTFSNFMKWYNLQNVKDGFQLDKDIVSSGNKIYCPEYCRFIPSQLNMLLTDAGAIRGECLIGVYWNKRNRKYKASIRHNGKPIHLGLFNDEYEAHKAYVAKKLCIIQEWVLYYKDIDLLISKGLFYHQCNLNNYVNRI